jgi:glycosyltransferase involved in cell wall biosynthesis
VFNGIDMSPFRELVRDDYQRVRRELGLASDTRIIGTICRLTKAKDLPTLVAMADILRTERDDVRVVIVGEGEEEAKLHELVEGLGLVKVVLFTGRRSDVARLLASFDVFVLTSVSEGMALALIEASAGERPIVTTDVGGSSDVVLDGVTGYVVPPGNKEAFLERIRHLLENPAIGHQLGAAARARALQLFDIEITCREYRRLYKTVEG